MRKLYLILIGFMLVSCTSNNKSTSSSTTSLYVYILFKEDILFVETSLSVILWLEFVEILEELVDVLLDVQLTNVNPINIKYNFLI